MRRIELIRQSEFAECGLACILMIANYWGHSIDLLAGRQRFQPTIRGASLSQLIAMAAELQLSARPLRVGMAAISGLKLPIILHWSFSHFVVLESLESRGGVICDPARGRITVSNDEISRQFTGVALELVPAEGFQGTKARASISIGDLVGSAGEVVRELPKLFGAIAGIELAALAMPIVVRLLIDGASSAGRSATGDVAFLALLYAAFIVAASFAGFIRSALLLRIANQLLVPGAGIVVRHLLNLHYSYFEKRQPSDVSHRFDSLSAIHRGLTARMFDAVLDGCFAAAIVLALSLIDIRLGGVILVAGILLVAVHLTTAPLSRSRTAEALIASALQTTELQENVRGIQTIQIFGIQALRASRMLNAVVKTANARIREQLTASVVTLVQRALLGFALLAIIVLSVPQIQREGWSLGLLVLVITYATQALSRFEKFVGILDELRLVSVHKERLADIVLSSCEIPDAPGISSDDGLLDIEIKDLWFRHSPYDPWILKGVNFHVSSGESVAITGPSGCGKTTLIKILLGLLEPTRGEVLVNGVPLLQFGKHRLRGMCATVLQEDRLFVGSIAQNISLFQANATLEAIEECATAAGIHQEIDRMPMKYHTLLGNGTAGLSGGQVQRILLARALFVRPKLLLLDEATSHLDVAKEAAINECIRALRVTRIIVAHRPETIRSADRSIDLTATQEISRAERMALVKA